MNLYIPRRKRRGIPEKHIDVEVLITDSPVSLEQCKLDERGIKRVRQKTANLPFEVVTGFAYVKWRSTEHRQACKSDQELNTEGRTNGENRWTDIQKYKERALSGEPLPPPTVVHPSLTELNGLEVIDGIRRLVAGVEAGISPIAVAVIRRRAQS